MRNAFGIRLLFIAHHLYWLIDSNISFNVIFIMVEGITHTHSVVNWERKDFDILARPLMSWEDVCMFVPSLLLTAAVSSVYPRMAL